MKRGIYRTAQKLDEWETWLSGVIDVKSNKRHYG
jgi:hypothetical protein